MKLRDPAPVPVLLAVPHAGRAYPAEFAGIMRNQAAACLRLEDRFVDLVAEAVSRETGAALLIDLHSMPPLGPKRGHDAPNRSPTTKSGAASCDASLSAAAFDHFSIAGGRVAHNRPYAGGYVLDRHGAST